MATFPAESHARTRVRGARPGSLATLAALAAFLVAPAALASGLAVTAAAARTGDFGLEVRLATTCGDLDEHTVSDWTVTGTESFEACERLTAGPAFVVAPGGDATLRAGRTVTLASGFRVESGGSLAVGVDPSLLRVAYVQDDSPGSEVTYEAKLHVNLDAFALAATGELRHFAAYAAGGTTTLELSLRQDGGLGMVLRVFQDDGTPAETTAVPLVSGWNEVVFGWQAAPGASAFLSVNDGLTVTLGGLDTETRRIDFVRWGVLGGTLAEASGTIRQDDFTSRR
jgi:hypothetical protein